MEIVEPIRDKAKITELKQVLGSRSIRNKLLFVLGINTGLRISDLLPLTLEDLDGKSHLVIREEKTGKAKRIILNAAVQAIVKEYKNITNCKDATKKIFDISRIQAYRILNDAARSVGLVDRIGTHTLRKTFGYHHYQKYKDVALLQNIFNHASPSYTLRYIGIGADMMDKSVEELDI